MTGKIFQIFDRFAGFGESFILNRIVAFSFVHEGCFKDEGL